MRLAIVLLFLSPLIISCASAPPQPEMLPTLHRVKPVEAMGPSSQSQVHEACKFRKELANLTAEEQLAFIRNCVEILGPAYRDEVKLRAELARWIEAE